LAFFEMEVDMHRTVLAAAATVAILAGASLAPQRAEAMPATDSGLAAAVTGNSLAQDVAYICRRAWRCGPYGCGWRRACYWSGPRRYWGPRYYRRHWRRW
jgi:hypothetical protein